MSIGKRAAAAEDLVLKHLWEAFPFGFRRRCRRAQPRSTNTRRDSTLERAVARPRLHHVHAQAACGGPRGMASMETPIIASRIQLLRSEEHTSELQSQFHLVCRLL